MTIAELHGKLNPARPEGVSERMEDLLTSDVFGTMKYAGWDKGFWDWIQMAEIAPVSPSPPSITNLLNKSWPSKIYFKFWPLLENGREPDLAILVELENGRFLIIVVEVKYLSGTSDWDDDEKAKTLDITGSQLADQVMGLYMMPTAELMRWFEIPGRAESHDVVKAHLFITTHSVLPVLDYEKAATRMNGPWPIPSYWLSWDSLAQCFEGHLDQEDEGISELLKDLDLLLKRKGLVPFSGFRMEPLLIQAKSPSFWGETYWTIRGKKIPAYQAFFRP